MYGTVGGMEKTTLYLTPNQKRALARAARASGRSEAVTSRHRAAEPTLPLFESGQSDLAERVEEYLAGFGER